MEEIKEQQETEPDRDLLPVKGENRLLIGSDELEYPAPLDIQTLKPKYGILIGE